MVQNLDYLSRMSMCMGLWLGGVISKIVTLIKVPIITRIMPNPEYFGISNMSKISSLLVARYLL